MDNDTQEQEECPQCHVGHIQISYKPFLRLYQGHLFTIPYALCYQCDICDYYEFDEKTFTLISDMVLGATGQAGDDGKTRPLPTSAEDELPTQQKPPTI